MGLGSDPKNVTLISVKDIISDSLKINSNISSNESKAMSTLTSIKDGFFKTRAEEYYDDVLERISKGFKTYKELHEFLKNYMKLIIPYKKNCFDNHTAPFEFVADAVLDKHFKQFVIGPRGGSKSYSAGLVQWILANKYPLYEGKTLGGSADQSMKSYEAMLDFWDKAGQDSKAVLVDAFPRKMFTKWKTGANVSILSASQKSVRGPHPNCVCSDTFINTEAGIKKIVDIIPFLDKVWAYTGKDFVLRTVQALFNNGYSDTIKLFLSNNQVLECTLDHKIYTLNRGWVKADEIKLSDELCEMRGISKGCARQNKFTLRIYRSLQKLFCGENRGDSTQVQRMWNKIKNTFSKNNKGGDNRTDLLQGMQEKTVPSKKKLLFGLWCRNSYRRNKMQAMLGQNTSRDTNGRMGIREESGSVCKHFKEISSRLFTYFKMGNSSKKITNFIKCNLGASKTYRKIYSGLLYTLSLLGYRSRKECYRSTKNDRSKSPLLQRAWNKLFNSLPKHFGTSVLGYKNTGVVTLIRKERGNYQLVYDLQVEEHHNYLAAGIILSNCLILDEVDEMEYDILTAALQQPMSKNNIPARTIMLSTYHKVRGTVARLFGDAVNSTDVDDVQDEINAAKSFKKNMKLYHYCIWETIESCKDYVCSTCPIANICPGTHMKGAVGYYKIDDFVQKIQLISKYSLEAEWFCRRPSRKGLVLEGYNDSINTINQGYIPGLPVYISVDFGFTATSPYVVEFFQEVENFKLSDGRVISGTIMFDEIYKVPRLNKEIIEEVKARPFCANPNNIQCVLDNAEPDLANEWAANGFKVTRVNKKKFTIIAGLDKLIGKISPFLGTPTFYVNKKCSGFLNEKDSYKWGVKGDPLDADNHCFAGGTLITTKRGQIPIKDVKIGDLVLTRGGWQKVLASLITGYKDVYEFIVSKNRLVCTDTHPIFTSNREFIKISELSAGDYIIKQVSNCLVPVKIFKPIINTYIGKAIVYNLQVENYPEFFANNILVHNSIDTARYYIITRFARKTLKGATIA